MLEDAETAEWRSRCTEEMHRLRGALAHERGMKMGLMEELVVDYPQFYKSVQSTEHEIVLCFPATSNTITVYVFTWYPCIAAHLDYYGDKQLIRLIEAGEDDLEALGYGADVNRGWLLAILDMQLTPPPPEHR